MFVFLFSFFLFDCLSTPSQAKTVEECIRNCEAIGNYTAEVIHNLYFKSQARLKAVISMQKELAASGGVAKSVDRLPAQMPMKGGILKRKSDGDGPTFRKPDRPKRSLLGLDRNRKLSASNNRMSFDLSKDEDKQIEVVDEDQPRAKKAKTKKKKKQRYRKRIDDTPSHPGGVDHAKAAEIEERKNKKRRSSALESSTKKDRSENERRRASRRADQEDRRRKDQYRSRRSRGDRDRDRDRDRNRDRERRTRDRDRDRSDSRRSGRSSREKDERRQRRREEKEREKERAYVTLFQNNIGGDFEPAVPLNSVGNTPLTSPYHDAMKSGSATPLRQSDADSVVSDVDSVSTWEPPTPLARLQSQNRKGW